MPTQATSSIDLYIGVMTGTSMDGIDMVVASFDPLVVHATHTVEFPVALRQQLLTLSQGGADNEIELMGAADVALGKLIGQQINLMLAKHHIPAPHIKAIGSHGQTIRHRPEVGFSLQIGNPNYIAEITGINVIADFRNRDIAAGGQGAPLVPAFHKAVFSHATIDRVIVNLGGIANISVLPSSLTQASAPDSHVFGFDTGPANLLMDAWCYQHTAQPYDHNGAFAASGEVLPELLALLLAHPFFALPHPKSTGREDFNLAWLTTQLTQYQTTHANPKPASVQATLAALTATTVCNSIDSLPIKHGEVLICGGGVYNPVIVKLISQLLPAWQVASTATLGLDPTWVEAVAFAWLAQQRIAHKHANITHVTGASGGRVLGGLY